jgi:hypothetical protein
MELAFAESRCGDANSAAAHYTQCLASGGYSAAAFPPANFEDFIRCLIKVDRRQWAAQRLRERIAVDPSPRWTKMLAELDPTERAPVLGRSDVRPPASAAQVAASPAPTPTGPPELRSIIWSTTKPSAQLDKNMAFEGDRVGGYKVTKISQDSVDLLTPEGASLRARFGRALRVAADVRRIETPIERGMRQMNGGVIDNSRAKSPVRDRTFINTAASARCQASDARRDVLTVSAQRFGIGPNLNVFRALKAFWLRNFAPPTLKKFESFP